MGTFDVVDVKSMSTEDFASWIQKKGGDSKFITILASFGFTSKLSLGNDSIYVNVACIQLK